MTNSKGCGFRLPGFKTWAGHLLSSVPRVSSFSSLPWFLYLSNQFNNNDNSNNNNAFLTDGCEAQELIYIKH